MKDGRWDEVRCRWRHLMSAGLTQRPLPLAPNPRPRQRGEHHLSAGSVHQAADFIPKDLLAGPSPPCPLHQGTNTSSVLALMGSGTTGVIRTGALESKP